MPRIRIETIVKVVQIVPFNEDYYPDQDTPEEAVKYELDLDRGEQIELFAESLSSIDFVKVEEDVETGSVGTFTRTVTMIS